MDHMDELAEIRPLVEGEKVLFLGRDNFVLYELRGSRPFTHVRNFYDPYFVRPNFKLRDVGAKFDFDAVTSRTLAGFPYVITTRAAYASGPPPSYEAAHVTDSYVLWRADGSRSALRRLPVERGAEPTGRLPCALVRARPGGVAAVSERKPVRADAWTAATIESEEEATLDLGLKPGRWLLSFQYDATRPLTVTGPSLDAELPPNLDYRGVAPFWPAGEITVDGSEPVRLSATVESPPLAGRLLGASSVAHLGAVAATPAGRGYATGVEPPHPGAGERIVIGPSCGAEADWVIPPR
jgi:hypothetical protein